MKPVDDSKMLLRMPFALKASLGNFGARSRHQRPADAEGSACTYGAPDIWVLDRSAL